MSGPDRILVIGPTGEAVPMMVSASGANPFALFEAVAFRHEGMSRVLVEAPPRLAQRMTSAGKRLEYLRKPNVVKAMRGAP